MTTQLHDRREGRPYAAPYCQVAYEDSEYGTWEVLAMVKEYGDPEVVLGYLDGWYSDACAAATRLFWRSKEEGVIMYRPGRLRKLNVIRAVPPA